MINNLEKRREFWNQPQNRGPIDGTHDLKDSLPYPFFGFETYFVGKNALEIGPGRGRQYDYLKNFVKYYSICDISEKALSEKCFDLLENKLLLLNYGQNFHLKFDLIHFWYVLHHILEKELDEFFDFIYRHLEDEGLILFNTPQLQNELSAYLGDGIGTTYLTLDQIIECFYKRFNIKFTKKINMKSTGYFIIGQRK